MNPSPSTTPRRCWEHKNHVQMTFDSRWCFLTGETTEAPFPAPTSSPIAVNVLMAGPKLSGATLAKDSQRLTQGYAVILPSLQAIFLPGATPSPGGQDSPEGSRHSPAAQLFHSPQLFNSQQCEDGHGAYATSQVQTKPGT